MATRSTAPTPPPISANVELRATHRDAVAGFCATHGMRIVGEIAYDAGLADAERAGQPPLDYAPNTPSIMAMRRLAESLMASA